MNPFTRILQQTILRQRGQNQKLAQEVEKLSPQAQERLYRVLTGLEEDAHHERRKRRRGQW